MLSTAIFCSFKFSRAVLKESNSKLLKYISSILLILSRYLLYFLFVEIEKLGSFKLNPSLNLTRLFPRIYSERRNNGSCSDSLSKTLQKSSELFSSIFPFIKTLVHLTLEDNEEGIIFDIPYCLLLILPPIFFFFDPRSILFLRNFKNSTYQLEVYNTTFTLKKSSGIILRILKIWILL